MFGRFELRALLHKGAQSMLWLAFDPRYGQELMLCMPRAKPEGEAHLRQWQQRMAHVARVQHPRLHPVMESGVVPPWPYVAFERKGWETLAERLQRGPAPTPLESAQWLSQVLEGLAFAHEANLAHLDIQPAYVVLDATGQARLMGLELVLDPQQPAADASPAMVVQRQRESALADVVNAGLLLHRLLCGHVLLDDPDLTQVRRRLAPLGSELIRLGWETPYPIPEPLRAIANRAVDRQPRQRYHTARTFLRALEGWLCSVSADDGGAFGLLKDKLQRYGHLPAQPGTHLAELLSGAMDARHTAELSSLALQDMALTLELIRRVNFRLRQTQGADEPSVLNMQRTIAMLGLNGLRDATRNLRSWPGVLGETQAAFLEGLMRRVARAGYLAQRLRPAGYDGEVVYLINLLQNLGRLLVQYHFAEDAQQIRQLMLSPEPSAGQPQLRGLTEQSAAYAVLGVDLETLAQAVARYWGLDEEVLQMMRSQAPDAPVRHADTDAELLRLTCSLANELVGLEHLPEARRLAAAEQVARRYARALGLTLKDIHQACQEPVREGIPSARQVSQPESNWAPLEEAVAPPPNIALAQPLRRSRLRDLGGPPTQPAPLSLDGH
ncbi:HDOD domain-containing protein [Roseateles sp. BYS180W]|uniref:HDOD domain-containing protein n=1 Tax=Roseateles rivi TaxID=3299028 RepID=A0ABW7FVM8_9BURK